MSFTGRIGTFRSMLGNMVPGLGEDLMAAVKTFVAFTWNTGSSTASGTTNPVTTPATHYADDVWGDIVQVGTATTPANVQVVESPDNGTTWYALDDKLFSAGLSAGTYSFVCPLEVTTTDVELVYTQQAGGTSSTLTAQLSSVTGI